jgi:hypothetical protein
MANLGWWYLLVTPCNLKLLQVADMYLFLTNCTFCWLTYTLLTLQHVLANNNSKLQAEY